MRGMAIPISGYANRRAMYCILALLFVSLLGAFTRQGVAGKTAEMATVRLKWSNQAEFAGFYCAAQQGLYTREGLGIVLKPGGPDITPEKRLAELVSGNVTFSMLDAAQVLDARARGMPVVTIAAIFQKSPVIYATMKDGGIARPQELNGKAVMVPDDLLLQHNLLVNRLGLDPGQIKVVPFVQGTAPLANKEVDAQLMYRTDAAVDFEQQGYQLNRIWLEEYGVSIYSDVIVTTEATIKNSPALVEGFLRATLGGWRYAIENQEGAVGATISYDAWLDRAKQQQIMQAQVPLIHTGSEPVGMMSAAKWQEAGLLYMRQPGATVASQFPNLEKAYTLEFLDRVYLAAK